ncbi:hypothetical protein [Rhizobium leguminosarum]|uniref:hypothetical protein n=1 Tax=Rhizobium leguminosarum TaxID=384 RepID=UPI0013E94C7D|nr:hypothetical protein [Rhizobium leguminosarum]
MVAATSGGLTAGRSISEATRSQWADAPEEFGRELPISKKDGPSPSARSFRSVV